jgi:hypothetical protein
MSTGAQGIATLTFDAGAQAAEYSSSVSVVDSDPANEFGTNTNARTLSTIQTLTSPAKPNPGSNFAAVTVTGQTALTATDAIDVWIQGTDSTASHNAYEHQITPIRLAVTNVIAGVGFDITAYSDLRLDGDFQVRWAWVGGVGEKVGSAVINFPASAQGAEYASELVTVDSNPNPNAFLATYTNALGDSYDAVIFANNMFVAIGPSSIPNIYSYDGITWAASATVGLGTARSICWGGGVFVATAVLSGTSYRSVDGINWTAGTLPSVVTVPATVTSGGACAYGNSIFVALSAAGGTVAASSPDGITWTQRAINSGPIWNSVTFGAGIFVACGTGTALYSTSPNGITWTQRSLPSSRSWYSVTFVNNLFLVVANNTNIVATSPDGVNWTQRALPVTASWRFIGFGAGKYIIVASNSGSAVTSLDGVTWVLGKLTGYGLYSFAYGFNRFVAVSGSSAHTSTQNFEVLADSRTFTNVNTLTNAAAPVPGTNSTSLTVTGLTTFNATDAVEVWVQGSDTTADHNEVEHALAPIQLRATNPVSGVGFTINATSPHRLDGDFKVRYAFTP